MEEKDLLIERNDIEEALTFYHINIQNYINHIQSTHSVLCYKS